MLHPLQSPFSPVKQGVLGRNKNFYVSLRLLHPFPVNCRSLHKHWVFAILEKLPI